MKISLNTIVVFILGAGCMILGVLYLGKGTQDGSQYKGQIKDLNSEIVRKDSIFNAIRLERQALRYENTRLLTVIDALAAKKYKNDSLRKVIKTNSDEKHTDIDNADLNKLSHILSRYLED